MTCLVLSPNPAAAGELRQCGRPDVACRAPDRPQIAGSRVCLLRGKTALLRSGDARGRRCLLYRVASPNICSARKAEQHEADDDPRISK